MLRDLLLLVLSGLVLAAATVVVAGWRLWRALRSSPRLLLRVRALEALVAPPGHRRQVAVLRRRLTQSVAATDRAVAIVSRTAGRVGDLPALAARLRVAAVTLDAELRLLAAEPELREVRRLLPAAGARVEDLTRAACSVRRAASAGLGAHAQAVLPALLADVEDEVRALSAGVETLLGLAAGPAAGPRAASWRRPA